MRGQWRGDYTGTSNGLIVVEIDDEGEFFEGSAYLYESNAALPGVHAYFKTPNRDPTQQIRVTLGAIDPDTGVPRHFHEIAGRFPGVGLSDFADAEFTWQPDELRINWTTDLGTSGSATLPKSKSEDPSECPVLPVRTWAEFKQFATSFEPNRYIFRGQPGTWRLRTAFHRTGRSNLDKYLNNTMNVVHRHLSGTTQHKYDVRDPLQNAAFYNLIQHHGFPTPLLDWTYSPFVAAHFAFTDALADNEDSHARIYVFDKVT